MTSTLESIFLSIKSLHCCCFSD